MIYDADKGDTGRVFSNGEELDLVVKRVNTETGEVMYIPQPVVLVDGCVVVKTVLFENVTVEPL